MIGLDILHVPRIHALIYRNGTTEISQRLIQRILHPNEAKGLPTDPVALTRYIGTR